MRCRPRILTLLLAATTLPLAAGEPVRIELPVRARLDVTGYRSVAIVPFVFGPSRESAPVPSGLDRELERYLVRTLGRHTGLRARFLHVALPSADPSALPAAISFWRAVGERAGTDLILAGAVDFDLLDRSGYVTREFVSEHDGRTYHSQVLAEETGVELDLVLWVFEARSGRLLLSDNLKDFRSFPGESIDPLSGLFSGLARLEDRLLGIFVRCTVGAERVLQ